MAVWLARALFLKWRQKCAHVGCLLWFLNLKCCLNECLDLMHPVIWVLACPPQPPSPPASLMIGQCEIPWPIFSIFYSTSSPLLWLVVLSHMIRADRTDRVGDFSPVLSYKQHSGVLNLLVNSGENDSAPFLDWLHLSNLWSHNKHYLTVVCWLGDKGLSLKSLCQCVWEQNRWPWQVMTVCHFVAFGTSSSHKGTTLPSFSQGMLGGMCWRAV